MKLTKENNYMNVKYEKTIIWDTYILSKNAGGPPGFIGQNLGNATENDHWIRISEMMQKENINIFNRLKNRLIALVFGSVALDKANLGYAINIYLKHKAYKYKAIFFHDVFSMSNLLPIIPKKQIIILQSHSPELPSDEILAIEGQSKRYYLAQKIEKTCFKKANYIVLPNLQCTTIYKDLIQNQSFIKPILSGCADFGDNLNELPIKTDTINLIFIGRQNAIKGFDILIDVFNEVSKLRTDIRLYLIGLSKRELPNDKIIQIGFSDRPQFWLKSMDYLINSNRSSYFDLSIMEALSCGKKIIMTMTEGHEFYINKSEDLISFKNKEELKAILLNLPSKKSEKIEFSALNKELYKKYFTPKAYVSRLNSFLSEI